MKTGFITVALAVMVLSGMMAGPSLAGNEGNTDWARSAETNPEACIGLGHLRGPVETGALPDARDSASKSGGIASSDAKSEDSSAWNRADLESP